MLINVFAIASHILSPTAIAVAANDLNGKEPDIEGMTLNAMSAFLGIFGVGFSVSSLSTYANVAGITVSLTIIANDLDDILDNYYVKGTVPDADIVGLFGSIFTAAGPK